MGAVPAGSPLKIHIGDDPVRDAEVESWVLRSLRKCSRRCVCDEESRGTPTFGGFALLGRVLIVPLDALHCG